jgi:hypothetical protein
MPPDFCRKQFIFPHPSIVFAIPTEDEWTLGQIDPNHFDTVAYTDGSLNDLGVGSGIFIMSNNPPIQESSHTIPLSPNSTIF